MKIIKKEFDPYFGSFVLETLTLGMYGESKTAIREYVQNSYDSLMSAIAEETLKETKAKINIKIDTDENFVSIRDNGNGLKKAKAVSTLTDIGASSKDFKSQAGFRGIGRLSGLVLCDKLIFRTKAKGENVETVVEFDAKGMRRDLSPSRARLYSLKEILQNNVKAYEEDTEDSADHFFEVKMQDLHDAPTECRDVEEMCAYLGEVAPVPYSPSFESSSRIRSTARAKEMPLEQVRIFVHNAVDDTDGEQVFKHYGASHLVQTTKVPLSDVEIVESPTGLWWGWIGKKEKSGFYKEDRVKAIRVRVRNIQIDGVQVIGRIFSELPDAASYGRFNDWYIGEIFADPERLIPNARRDGFEELDDWHVAKSELSEMCRKLGREAYALSKKSQGDLTALIKQADRAVKQANTLFSENDPDIKDVSKTITEIDKIQRKVNRATQSSENIVAGQLRSIEMRLLQSHKKALSKIKAGTFLSSPEIIAKAQYDIVKELVAAFNEEFDRPSFARIMKVVTKIAGENEW